MSQGSIRIRTGAGLASLRQKGFTLIELLVSMVIGMVMIGALIAIYSNSSSTAAAAQAQVQMTEDGQYALRLMAQHIRLAGFNPVQPSRTTRNDLPGGSVSFAVFGCGSGFTNAGGTATVATDATALVCASTGTSSHAISVSYEADLYNTSPTRSGTIRPTDCLGQGLTQLSKVEGATTFFYYVAENRFYLSNNRLMCAGSGDFTNPQTMVENIESIQFQYGARNPAITTTSVIGGFLTAPDIGATPAGTGTPGNATMAAVVVPADRWARVIAVRVCVVVKSSAPIFPEATSYFGCNPEADGDPIPITDGFMRKAFVSTVVLRNRMSTN